MTLMSFRCNMLVFGVMGSKIMVLVHKHCYNTRYWWLFGFTLVDCIHVWPMWLSWELLYGALHTMLLIWEEPLTFCIVFSFSISLLAMVPRVHHLAHWGNPCIQPRVSSAGQPPLPSPFQVRERERAPSPCTPYSQSKSKHARIEENP